MTTKTKRAAGWGLCLAKDGSVVVGDRVPEVGDKWLWFGSMPPLAPLTEEQAEEIAKAICVTSKPSGRYHQFPGALESKDLINDFNAALQAAAAKIQTPPAPRACPAFRTAWTPKELLDPKLAPSYPSRSELYGADHDMTDEEDADLQARYAAYQHHEQAERELRDEVAMARCLARRLERFSVTDAKECDDPRRVAWRETLWDLLRESVEKVPRTYPPHDMPMVVNSVERAAKVVALLAAERQATIGWKTVSKVEPSPPF